MQISDAVVGFPDVTGYVLHAHLKSQVPEAITLWFHRAFDDLKTMTNVRVFLLKAAFRVHGLSVFPSSR